MKKIFRNLLFPFMGIMSLIWFLVRVIPKPSRAAYPCMRVAAPMASTFVIYLIGLTSSLFFLKKAKKYFHETRYVLFLLMLFISAPGCSGQKTVQKTESIMGTDVTIIGRSHRVLDNEDPEVCRILKEVLAGYLKLVTSHEAVRVEQKGGNKVVFARSLEDEGDRNAIR